MSKKIVLCADSTCDLGEELIKRYNVHTIPYHITLEDKDYLDSVTITTGELYRAYYDRKVLPKTAAINIGDFTDFWKPFLDEGCEVIHINLGSAISSTHRNACLVAEELEGVYPIDSQNLSTGMGHVVIEAAKLIEQGLEAKEIAEKLKEITTRVHSSFILNTLEFMHAGGRCSTVAALGANLLKLKPCIVVDNLNGSAMGVGKKYRGELGNALVAYTKDQLNKYTDIITDKIFITHTDIDPKYVELVRKTICETMQFDEIFETNASCTIGSHCGPGCLGILFMTES